MNASPLTTTLVREELFERIWTTPAVRLAREFGISEVALGKLCRRRNIPTPPRGYWARLDAGQQPPRAELPPARAGENRPATFHLRTAPPTDLPTAPATIASSAIATPSEEVRLHPLAERVRHCLRLYKLGPHGLVQIRENGLPRIDASPGQGARVARAVHILITASAARGCVPDPSATGPLEFRRGERRATIRIEETLSSPDPAASRSRRRPAGRLRFVLGTPGVPVARAQCWIESTDQSLPTILAEVPVALELFLNRDPVAAPAPLRFATTTPTTPRLPGSARRRDLARAAAGRIKALCDAAEAWRVHREVNDYLIACEAHWRRQTPGAPSPEQRAWLEWARSVADNLSPFVTPSGADRPPTPAAHEGVSAAPFRPSWPPRARATGNAAG